ncbi:MAG: hypothetical protein OXG15_12125 [Gammaproteobacteria bacterium]|nr:hypothetical protein [Gammaproteobacteria bacterium]
MSNAFNTNDKLRNVAIRLLEIKGTSVDLSSNYRMQGGADYVDIRVHRPTFRNVDCEDFDDVLKELS